jgi:hypothetical protein
VVGSDRAAGPGAVVGDDGGPSGAGASSRSVPAWVRGAFDEVVIDAAPLRWGFRNETWLAELANGRRFAVSRLVDRAAAAILPARIAAVQPRLVAVGLPVLALVEPDVPRAGGVLVSPFQDGVPGPDILGEPSGPAVVGSLLGSAWRRLAAADPVGLDLPDLWASPDRLASAARWWLVTVSATLPRRDRARLAAAIETLPGLLEGPPARIVHGDLVPANILVQDGVLVALLDLEFVRLGDRRLDAAWFEWMVWFHHRSVHPVAWEAFAAAGGIERGDVTTREVVRVLPAIRMLEILDDLERDDRGRSRWLEHLSAWLARS